MQPMCSGVELSRYTSGVAAMGNLLPYPNALADILIPGAARCRLYSLRSTMRITRPPVPHIKIVDAGNFLGCGNDPPRSPRQSHRAHRKAEASLNPFDRVAIRPRASFRIVASRNHLGAAKAHKRSDDTPESSVHPKLRPGHQPCRRKACSNPPPIRSCCRSKAPALRTCSRAT